MKWKVCLFDGYILIAEAGSNWTTDDLTCFVYMDLHNLLRHLFLWVAGWVCFWETLPWDEPSRNGVITPSAHCQQAWIQSLQLTNSKKPLKIGLNDPKRNASSSNHPFFSGARNGLVSGEGVFFFTSIFVEKFRPSMKWIGGFHLAAQNCKKDVVLAMT